MSLAVVQRSPCSTILRVKVGSLAVTSSGLCLTADIPVQPEASVIVEVGALAGGQRARPFRHWWKTAVGSGHAALTLRADWREHMSMAREHCGLESVRFHGMRTPNDNSCCILLHTETSALVANADTLGALT